MTTRQVVRYSANVETSSPLRIQPRPPLRDVRLAQKLSLREVARAAGIDAGYLSRIERGEAQPSSEVLLRIARVLGLSGLVGELAPYTRGDR